MVAAIALFYAKLFEFDDLFEELTQRFSRAEPPAAEATPAWAAASRIRQGVHGTHVERSRYFPYAVADPDPWRRMRGTVSPAMCG
jgi:hypothetical protein